MSKDLGSDAGQNDSRCGSGSPELPEQRKEKHTPGPWVIADYWRYCDKLERAKREDQHPDWREVVGGSFSAGNSLSMTGHCGEANARLIAAAPDLLEALVEAERFLDYFANGRTAFVGSGTPRTAWEQVRAAIAKAQPGTTGEDTLRMNQNPSAVEP